MKRRSTAVRRNGNEDTSRRTNDRAARTAKHTWPKSSHQLQRHEKHAQAGQRYRRHGETIFFRFLAFSLVVVAYCLALNIYVSKISSFLYPQPPASIRIKEKRPSIAYFSKSRDSHYAGFEPANYRLGKKKYFARDFGGLEMEFFRDYRTTPRDDDLDYYYNFDDDHQRNPFNGVNEKTLSGEEEKCCRRTSEHRLNFPNCNTFHETPMLESKATHIG